VLVSGPELLLHGQLSFRLLVFAHDSDQELFHDPELLFKLFAVKHVGLYAFWEPLIVAAPRGRGVTNSSHDELQMSGDLHNMHHTHATPSQAMPSQARGF